MDEKKLNEVGADGMHYYLYNLRKEKKDLVVDIKCGALGDLGYLDLILVLCSE